MDRDQPRRPSVVTFGSAEPIPRAPPLPAPRPLGRVARDAANRLFGYNSRPPSPQEDDRIVRGGRHRYPSLSATQNATASHRTGLEINTIAINESGTHALIGGHEIFKTVKVEDGVCAEELNLRSAIRSAPTEASGKARSIYSIDIADVAWAKGDSGHYVAAATASGKIILYDLGHAGTPAAQLHEHHRQVHKVTFNPHSGSLLLSGSQDGTVRLWDVRDVRRASTLQSRKKYSGQSDGVRDVKWSPTEGYDFAFGTDGGFVQCWDTRNLKTAKVKLPSHEGTCTTIDWHPDGKHLVSAGVDKSVRVWDMATNRRQRSNWEIKTPHPVFNARWRPLCESSMPGENGVWQCTQLVTAYDEFHPVIHIWDFRRPALPFREMAPYPSAPTDLLWHSQDLLWTVGREGVFLQSDIQHAPKVIDKRNLQAFDVSPLGNINFAVLKRRNQRVPLKHGPHRLTSKSSSLSHSPDFNTTLSRSWGDDSLDHSFLRAPTTQREDSFRSNNRAQSMSSAASRPSIHLPTLTFTDALVAGKSLIPLQISATGRLPGMRDPNSFAYLAQNYQMDFASLPKDGRFYDSYTAMLRHNEECANAVGLYRVGQSWNILISWTVIYFIELEKYRNEQQSEPLASLMSEPKAKLSDIVKTLLSEQTQSISPSPEPKGPITSIAQQLAWSDIASDQRTPLAMPVAREKEQAVLDHTEKDALPDLDKDDVFKLPPSLSPALQQSEINALPGPHRDRRLTATNLDGLQKLQHSDDAMDKASMVHRWSVQPKEPLNLELVDSNGHKTWPKLEKHNSNESFTFLDTTSDPHEPSLPSSAASAASVPLQLVAERPSRVTRAGVPIGHATTAAIDFDAPPNGTPAMPIHQVQHLSGRPENDHGLHVDSDGEAPHDIFEVELSVPDTKGLHIRAGSDPVESVESARYLTLPSQSKTSSKRISAPPVLPSAPTLVKGDDENEHVAIAALPPNNQSSTTGEDTSLFLPRQGDRDIEEGKVLTLVGMVRDLVKHHSDHGDAQNAACLLLALGPILPRTHPLPEREIYPTITSFVDAYTVAGFSPEEIEVIADTHLQPHVESGLQPLQTESILSTYHEQLIRHGLLYDAANLRTIAYPAYPAVYEQYLKDNVVFLRCGACGKPMKSGSPQVRCDSCRKKQQRCTICLHDESPLEDLGGNSKLLTVCLRCNHAAHAACLQAILRDGETGCPVLGCGCECFAAV